MRIKLILTNERMQSTYITVKNTTYSATSEKWISINVDFIAANNKIRLDFHQIDTADADICFDNLMKTRSVF